MQSMKANFTFKLFYRRYNLSAKFANEKAFSFSKALVHKTCAHAGATITHLGPTYILP